MLTELGVLVRVASSTGEGRKGRSLHTPFNRGARSCQSRFWTGLCTPSLASGGLGVSAGLCSLSTRPAGLPPAPSGLWRSWTLGHQCPEGGSPLRHWLPMTFLLQAWWQGLLGEREQQGAPGGGEGPAGGPGRQRKAACLG